MSQPEADQITLADVLNHANRQMACQYSRMCSIMPIDRSLAGDVIAGMGLLLVR